MVFFGEATNPACRFWDVLSGERLYTAPMAGFTADMDGVICRASHRYAPSNSGLVVNRTLLLSGLEETESA
jgi:hypothetical protein